ncbi:helix-turn-helix domain-containing protein [Azospirillum soli]|uniref:helix-turn-helix domain-containing protein n=1 Tax=Azospirillum soli TaxID=1304799 RepID=UPI001AE33FE9|nr:helix-turn-helix transcriptional regulator [Azospirillum soli]MBP2312617.1 transcriptional regulator with XRE-family HTH domain [Azospirillum soli]
MISAAQCRAARAWLNITQEELAQRAGVGVSTVRDFERSLRSPIRQNLGALERAFAEMGVTLLKDDADKAVGIRIDDGAPGGGE